MTNQNMLLPIPAQTCSIQGLKIRYAVIGKGEPLLLLHGFGAMMEYWYQNISDWAQYYQVIVCDLPGFGYSDPVNMPADIHYYADFIKHFLDALSVPSAYIVAHSLGGAVALRFSECHRAYVKKLVLISSVGFASKLDWGFRLLTLPLLGKILLQANRDQFAAAIRAHVYQPDCLDNGFIDFLYEAQQNPANQQLFLALLRENANLFGIKSHVLKPILNHLHLLEGLPMLILWGREDHVLDYNTHAAAAKKALPTIPFITIDCCGHLPQLEHSDLVNKAVREFLPC